MNFFKFLFLVFLIGSFSSCTKCSHEKSDNIDSANKVNSNQSENNIDQPAAEKSSNDDNKAKTSNILYAFINPNGSPCQMQMDIIEANREEISKYAEISYIRTTIPFERSMFYQYGVRSLPSLILTDKDGTVIKKFPPGIQKYEKLLPVLKGAQK